MYGLFQHCDRIPQHPRGGPWGRARGMGPYQPPGRLRQRQPGRECLCDIKYYANKLVAHYSEIYV